MKIFNLMLTLAIVCLLTNCEPTDSDVVRAEMIPSIETYGPGEFSPQIGGFITPQRANEKLTKMLDRREKLLDAGWEMEGVYGNVFGIEKFEEFIQKAKALNADGRSGDERITAIRIYQAIGTSEINGVMKEHKDLFLIPVQKNGEDYINVHNVSSVSNARSVNESVIFNSSLPCPSACP